MKLVIDTMRVSSVFLLVQHLRYSSSLFVAYVMGTLPTLIEELMQLPITKNRTLSLIVH